MNLAKYRILTVTYMLLVLGVSSISGQAMPDLQILSWDKLLHVLEYMILGILVVKSFPKVTLGMVIMVIIGGILFAGLDEFVQYFVPGRFSDRYDMVADAVGILLGSTGAALLQDRKR